MQAITKNKKRIQKFKETRDSTHICKYVLVVPLKDKNDVTITNDFQKKLAKSRHKPKKIWVDKDSEFYDKSMRSWLQENIIEMCSTHNEG